jgi:imidazolonepropionase-like amidohydrolase
MHLRALLLPLLATSLWAADPVTVRCGHLLDVVSGAMQGPTDVLIKDGRITALSPAGTANPDINLPLGYCTPGLMDVHDHLTGDPTQSGYSSLGISVPRQTIIGVKNARATLLAGFTTVRNVGASGYSDVALRDAIQAGEVEGPRIFVSGPALGMTGGHCDNNLLAPEFNYKAEGVADGPWPLRAKVREVIKHGADVIKICASGGVLSKGDAAGATQLTLEEITAIVEESHKLGRKVAAHAHGTQSIKDAIRGGVDSVEHCSLIDDEGIRLAKEKGAFLVFDIYNDTYILDMGAKNGLLPEMIEKEKQVGKLQRENFRKAWKSGARMAFGSDGGVYPHGDNWKQFPYMIEYGMKPLEAIRAATTEAAELIGLKGQAGVLASGAYADLIAVDTDPTTNVNAFGAVKFVMKEGKVYRNDWAGK